MNRREAYNAYKNKNKYHVWVTDTTNGRRVLMHYKDRAEAMRQNKNSQFKVGQQTTASAPRKKSRQARPTIRSPFGGIPKFRF